MAPRSCSHFTASECESRVRILIFTTPHSSFLIYKHGRVHALVYIMLHQCSEGMQAGAFSLGVWLQVCRTQWWGVALRARSERAEQWSRSAKPSGRGHDQPICQSCCDYSSPQTLYQQIQWKKGGQEHAEMEGNSQYAIIKWSPLYWWLKGSDTVGLHPEYITLYTCEELKSSRRVSVQLEIINLRVSGFALSNRRSLLLHKTRLSVRQVNR